VVGLAKCPVLRAASVWSDYRRQEILRSIRKFEAGNCGKATGIGEQEGRRLPLRQRQTTHFGDQAEIKELWLGSQHPLYSPDIAPSDYYLFQSLQNNLEGQYFDSMGDIQKYLENFFAQKSRGFYENGIRTFPERWQKIVDQDG